MELKEIIGIIKHAVMITSFVIVMMLLIEFINVITHGDWQKKIKHAKFGQYLLASILGATPGCLGAFTVVSLYSHKILSFGALVAAMIATSGDETYLMLSLFPLKALGIMFLLALVGIVAGYLTDKFYKHSESLLPEDIHELELHKSDENKVIDREDIFSNLKSLSFQRALLLFLLASALFLLLTGQIAPKAETWVKLTFGISTALALILASIVSEHFLEKHFWEHVIKKHLIRIFAWTFAALFVVAFFNHYFDVSAWIADNIYTVLIIAVLIGLIPESGPHMIFVTLFAQGLLPFGILFASSVVQDGHGTLPLLAVSKKSWIVLKLINLAFGLALGFVLLLWSV
jgi:hypothetical protein